MVLSSYVEAGITYISFSQNVPRFRFLVVIVQSAPCCHLEIDFHFNPRKGGIEGRKTEVPEISSMYNS